MKCKWESEFGHGNCSREAIDKDGYCIFHKPSKSVIEGKIFWHLVNFDNQDSQINLLLENLFSDIQQLYSFNEFDDFDLSGFDDFDIEEEFDSENDIGNELESESDVQKDVEDDEEKYENEDRFESLEERLKTITEEQFIELFESLNSKKEIVRFDIGIVDFLGFVFPAFPSNKIKFNIYKLQLEYARYYNFAEAVFEGEARFDYHTFDNAMLFSHTEFKEILTFKESTIMSDIEFDGVTFKPFIQYDSHNTFWRTQVQGKNFIMKNIDSCISIEGILMSKNTNLVLENVNFTRLNLIAGEQAFRLAKQQSTIIGDKKKASEYNFREMSIKGDLIMPPLKIWRKDNEGKKKFVMFQNIKLYKHYKYILPKLGDILSRLTLGYGEKPTRSLGISFLVILFFSLAFMKSGLTFSFVQENSGIIQYDFNLIEIFKVIFQLDIDTIVKVSQEWGNFFYFSIVTFSTVGYGDITTVNALGRFLASIEMALGVTMAGIWVATLLRKMMN